MASRSRSRQFALQMIYQLNFVEAELEGIWDNFWHDIKADEATREFCRDLVVGVLDHRHELDLEIANYLKGWSVERLAMTDRIILEIGLYELMFAANVPPKAVIDEAVELAKLFGSDKSITFVNGVLHAWATRNGMLETDSTSETG